MELIVNDEPVPDSAADDIARALDADDFPEDWSIVLETDDDDMLDAQWRPDGGFSLVHAGKGHKRIAAAPLDAAAVKAIYLKFFNGDKDWDRACQWRPWSPTPRAGAAPKPTADGTAKAKPKFVPAKAKLLVGAKGNGEPPAWAIAIIVGIVGFIIVMSILGQWDDDSFFRTHVPGANSTSFYVVLFALPVIAMLGLATGIKVWELRKSQSWSQTTGTIVRSGIEQRRQGVGNDAAIVNVPAVEYEFMAGAQKVRGRRIGIGDDSGGENTEATLARYAKGATVTVYYDPNDPAQCVLERAGPQGITAKGCAGALAQLAAFAAAVYVLIAYGPAFIDAHFPKAESNIVIAAFCVGLFLLVFFIAARRNSKQATNWPSVRGTVVKSEVQISRETIDGHVRTFYRPAVEFAYSVNGREYRSNQIKVGMTVSGTQSYAETVVAKYREGSAIEVHYDPKNPGNAALDNPTGATWIVAALAAASFAFAVWQLGVFK